MAATYTDLAGKVVLVTGGASGIGEAIVRRFAAQEARVGFLDIKDEEGQALAAELGATVQYFHADLTQIHELRASIARVREAFGPIAVLVNNAAHDERHRTEDVTPEYWDDRVAVNLRHQFFAAQAVLPDMQAAGGFLTGLGFTGWGWLWPLLIPPVGALVGFAATRAAALRMLREVR